MSKHKHPTPPEAPEPPKQPLNPLPNEETGTPQPGGPPDTENEQ